jgi:hypothetical protein
LGPKEFPKSSLKNLSSWIDKHPGWTIKFWTDIDRPTPHPKMQKVLVQDSDLPHLLTQFFLSDNLGEKSELLRYEIPSKRGCLCRSRSFCQKSVEPLLMTSIAA